MTELTVRGMFRVVIVQLFAALKVLLSEVLGCFIFVFLQDAGTDGADDASPSWGGLASRRSWGA